MREIGKMIYNMDMVQKVGMMEVNIKVIMFMEGNKVKVHILGQMDQNMKEV